MSTMAIPRGAGSTVGGIAGAAGGRVLGGIIGSVFGPLGTVAGQYAGGIAGRALGSMAGGALEDYLSSNMDDANEKAEEEEDAKAEAPAKADEDPCPNCNPRCRELEQEMKDEMYANKRGPGGQGRHGLANRRAEQICGQYGPGQTKMESIVKDGIHVLRESIPWDTHDREIQIMQERLSKMRNEYLKLGCKDEPKRNFNYDSVDKMTDPSFNPKPSEWLGADHPSCAGLGDVIKSNATPELPHFPTPSRSNPGVPMS